MSYGRYGSIESRATTLECGDMASQEHECGIVLVTTGSDCVWLFSSPNSLMHLLYAYELIMQMRSNTDNKVEQSCVDRRRRRHPVVRLRQIDDHRRPLHRCCLPPSPRSRWRAKHVTEVNDITCNYDRLISGSAKAAGALTRSALRTEGTPEPPRAILRNSD